MRLSGKTTIVTVAKKVKKTARGVKSAPWSDAERAAWELPEEMTVSQWAEKNRIIGDYSAEPGPWRNSRAAYLVGIMDAYTDPEVEQITIVGPAQCGKTEAVFNMIGYTVDVDPTPSMYVIARDEDAGKISDNRLKPMFQDIPALARHLSGSPRDFLKGSQFTFDRMNLYFATAQSAASLSSTPIGRVFLDETDKYPETVGNEGSPAKLAKRRTTTFTDTKVVNLCTPTTEEGYINVSYQKSNMCAYMMPCPCCGEYIRLVFANLKVDPAGLRDPEMILQLECVYYECQECGGHIDESQKHDMDMDGVWCPEGCTVNGDGTLSGKPKRSKRHTGLWIDGTISPWILWHEMLAEWFEICDVKEGDTAALREFLNQVICQVWREQAKEVEYKKLVEKKNELLRRAVPVGCKTLTAGADYHKDHAGNVRIDYEVRAWAPGMRDYVVSAGSVESFDFLAEEVLWHPFPWAGADIDEEELAVTALFIDSGDYPDDVYDFCAEYPEVCWPTKGQQTQRTPLSTSALDKVLEQADDRKRRRKSKRYKGMLLINIDTTFFKTAVVSRAERERGETNSTEFYEEIPQRYFKEFCNEHKVKHRAGGVTKYVWQPVSKGAPCHFLDTAVLASAAGRWKKVQDMRLGGERKAAAAKNKTPRRRRRIVRRGGYLGDMPEVKL